MQLFLIEKLLYDVNIKAAEAKNVISIKLYFSQLQLA